MDNSGNLYVALSLVGTNCQIVKVTPDGIRNSFGTTGTSFGNAIKVGPDGGIYIARKPKLDIILRLLCTHKIEKALRDSGVKEMMKTVWY
jgi:hypothetical protein